MEDIEIEAERLQVQLKLDPMTIVLIIQAILAAMQVIQDCRSNAKNTYTWAHIRRAADGVRERRRVIRAIQRRVGIWYWNKIGSERLVDAMIQRAKSQSGQWLERLYRAAIANA